MGFLILLFLSFFFISFLSLLAFFLKNFLIPSFFEFYSGLVIYYY